MLWAAITAATAAVVSFFADALGALIPPLASGSARSTALVAMLIALAMLNIAGVRGANRFNAMMTVAKLLPLVVLVVAGIGAVRIENLHWSSAPAPRDVARASAVLIFAFLGVETALVPSGEVREPARTVPRAIFIAMIGITLLYLMVQLVTQGILGSALVGQRTPVAEAAARAMGGGGRTLILVGSTVAMFGGLSGLTLAVPRMLFAFARDGFLPESLATVHSRFKTPYVAIITQTLIVIGLAVTGSFEKLAIIANGSVLLVYAACCLAVIQLRRAGIQGNGAPFRVPFASMVPILAVAVIAWLMTSLSASEWKALLLLLGVAVVVYAASLPSRRAARAGIPV
jgi:basic amino acid/polyamine antiporter, APA family